MHFSVLIISKSTDIEGYLEPYDVNLITPMHLCYTRQELIDWEKKFREDYKNGVYAEYLQDKEAFVKTHANNKGLLDYVQNEFPKRLLWTDDQLWEHAVEDYKRDEEREGNYEVHSDGSVWSIYNHKGKWDWYRIGGSWRGLIQLKKPDPEAPLCHLWAFGEKDRRAEERKYNKLKKAGFCDQAMVKDIKNLMDLPQHVGVIIREREWLEHRQFSWQDSEEDRRIKDEWVEKLKGYLSELKETDVLTMVDCHS